MSDASRYQRTRYTKYDRLEFTSSKWMKKEQHVEFSGNGKLLLNSMKTEWNGILVFVVINLLIFLSLWCQSTRKKMSLLSWTNANIWLNKMYRMLSYYSSWMASCGVRADSLFARKVATTPVLHLGEGFELCDRKIAYLVYTLRRYPVHSWCTAERDGVKTEAAHRFNVAKHSSKQS